MAIVYIRKGKRGKSTGFSFKRKSQATSFFKTVNKSKGWSAILGSGRIRKKTKKR